jgi:hypothetical protein
MCVEQKATGHTDPSVASIRWDIRELRVAGALKLLELVGIVAVPFLGGVGRDGISRCQTIGVVFPHRFELVFFL